MTTDFPRRPSPDGTTTPPPGCPAHGPTEGSGGPRRLHGPEAEADQRGLYEALRAEHGAVAPVLLHDDVPAWLVLGHAENLQVTRSPGQFSMDSRLWSGLRDGTVRPDHPLAPIFTWQPVCAFVEGTQHSRLRAAITESLKRLNSRGLRRYINRSSNELINKICEQGRGDLVSQFAEHLPMMVMTHIIGMPEEYNDRMVEAARDMIKGTETANASNAYVMDALHRLVARRKREPDEDFTTWLIEHEAGLTDKEAAEHLRVTLIAAYETTANLIANVLRMVFTDPRFRSRFGGGQMTLPEAVEQTLWDEPPFSAMLGRYAVSDSELGGQHIKAGDALLLGIAAANTDPLIRPDLEANMRGNRAHLAFGGGPHECPGQDIGRAIADVGVDALLMRLPDVRLTVEADTLEWTGSILSRHLVQLPVRFEPRPPQDVVATPRATPHPPSTEDWLVSSVPQPRPAVARAEPAGPVRQAEGNSPLPSRPPTADGEPVRNAPGRMWAHLVRWWRGY
ncbi:cytochrome P450 [Streptomyces tsukubensis]|uniref:Cytochrome n=1 Tax=Streptomyces tsukubensis TaxID=83656 RepID=A0A1V4AEK7_9ACTN|nr:cytochrome P450 [Streptomyces tsukubensis]OON82248.1 cytochrome [Streptomyces tsukubensis]QFR92739.1 cytochrome P450 [Streptomyces tsukubensis]